MHDACAGGKWFLGRPLPPPCSGRTPDLAETRASGTKRRPFSYKAGALNQLTRILLGVFVAAAIYFPINVLGWVFNPVAG